MARKRCSSFALKNILKINRGIRFWESELRDILNELMKEGKILPENLSMADVLHFSSPDILYLTEENRELLSRIVKQKS